MERLGRATWPEKPRGSGEGDGNRPNTIRYISGERKRAQATDLRGIENSYAQYRLIAHGSLAVAAICLRHRIAGLRRDKSGLR